MASNGDKLLGDMMTEQEKLEKLKILQERQILMNQIASIEDAEERDRQYRAMPDLHITPEEINEIYSSEGQV